MCIHQKAVRCPHVDARSDEGVLPEAVALSVKIFSDASHCGGAPLVVPLSDATDLSTRTATI